MLGVNLFFLGVKCIYEVLFILELFYFIYVIFLKIDGVVIIWMCGYKVFSF